MGVCYWDGFVKSGWVCRPPTFLSSFLPHRVRVMILLSDSSWAVIYTHTHTHTHTINTIMNHLVMVCVLDEFVRTSICVCVCVCVCGWVCVGVCVHSHCDSSLPSWFAIG